MVLKKLPDICHIQYGYAFDSSIFSESEGVPLVRIRDVVRGYSETYTTERCGDEYIVQNGDMLIGMDGEFNIARWKGGKAYLNQRVCRLIPKDDVEALYLFYFMPSALKAIEEKTPFVTVKHLSARELNKVLVPVPLVEEQQRIANKLKNVDDLISFRQEQLAKLDELVKSRFIELFDACNCRISTFGKEFSFISRGKSPSYVELSDLAVINQACIYWNGLNFDKVKYNDVSYSGDRILQFGDVLVNSTGTGTLGRANIFMRRSADKRYMADSHVTIIRGSVSCHPVYIKCYLEQAKIQDAIYRNCVSGSTNQIELSKEKFKELELPVPPMTLQKQFAAFVEQTDKSKLAIQESLAELETLKKALMQKYFG